MECGAFAVHRQLDIVPRTDRLLTLKAGQFFVGVQPSLANAVVL